MKSYTKHVQLTAWIVELADILANESLRLGSSSTTPDDRPAESVDRSAAWLRQALGPLVMGVAAIYQPDE